MVRQCVGYFQLSAHFPASEKIYQRQVTKLGLSDCGFVLGQEIVYWLTFRFPALMGTVRFTHSHLLFHEYASEVFAGFLRFQVRLVHSQGCELYIRCFIVYRHLNAVQLLDIFSINPHTACNTHDLLGCPCGASGEGAADMSVRPEDLERAMEEAMESSDEDDDPMKGFMAASQVKQKDIDRLDHAVSGSPRNLKRFSNVIVRSAFQYLKQKRAQLAALGEWTHINCLRHGAVDRIDDDMLTHLIYSPEDTNTPVSSAPQSLTEKLLHAADKIMAEQQFYSRDQVPGGSISFLFERRTKSSVEDEEDAEE